MSDNNFARITATDPGDGSNSVFEIEGDLDVTEGDTVVSVVAFTAGGDVHYVGLDNKQTVGDMHRWADILHAAANSVQAGF